MKYTIKQRIEIAENVADLYSQGIYTLGECCKAANINYDTFRNWAATSVDDYETLPKAKQKELIRRGFVPEVHNIMQETKDMKEDAYENIKLRKSYTVMKQLIEGYYYKKEVPYKRKNNNGKMEVIGYSTYTKFKPPSLKAIIAVLGFS